MHVHFWPGETVTLGGMRTPVKSARLLASGRDVRFKQDEMRVQLTGLPSTAPDEPATVIAIECDGEPKQDTDFVRKNRQRAKA